MNLNALMASNDLVVPVLADFLSFHGLKLLFETVQSLEDDLGHVLDHIFIVINAYNQTFKLAKEAREALNEHYKEFLLKSVVRQCTKFAQASSEGRPIFVVDAASKGAVDIAALTKNWSPRPPKARRRRWRGRASAARWAVVARHNRGLALPRRRLSKRRIDRGRLSD